MIFPNVLPTTRTRRIALIRCIISFVTSASVALVVMCVFTFIASGTCRAQRLFFVRQQLRIPNFALEKLSNQLNAGECCAESEVEKIREEFWVSDRSCANFQPLTLNTFNVIICSDPGECNFAPNWDNDDVLDNMTNLAEHSSFQRGGYPYTKPSKDWVQSCDELVAALQSTEDDEMRGDIAVAIGQQNEQMRVAFVERGACVALEKALSLTSCDSSARYDIDFALRSLARHTSRC
jgi:hypothetical protein